MSEPASPLKFWSIELWVAWEKTVSCMVVSLSTSIPGPHVLYLLKNYWVNIWNTSSSSGYPQLKMYIYLQSHFYPVIKKISFLKLFIFNMKTHYVLFDIYHLIDHLLYFLALVLSHIFKSTLPCHEYAEEHATSLHVEMEFRGVHLEGVVDI